MKEEFLELDFDGNGVISINELEMCSKKSKPFDKSQIHTIQLIGKSKYIIFIAMYICILKKN